MNVFTRKGAKIGKLLAKHERCACIAQGEVVLSLFRFLETSINFAIFWVVSEMKVVQPLR